MTNPSPPESKQLLVVYHSATGGTEQLAKALVLGANAATTENAGVQAECARVHVVLKHATNTRPEDVLVASAYVFATPENLGAIAGLMKDFFDRCYYPALGKIAARPYASVICAGSDGQNAARQIERIATGWRLRAVAEPLIVCTHAQTPEAIARRKVIGEADLMRCQELGALMASGLGLGIF